MFANVQLMVIVEPPADAEAVLQSELAAVRQQCEDLRRSLAAKVTECCYESWTAFASY